jgi:N-acetyl-anhydromuramyl-L-alanine amidase AmpD
VKDPEIVVTADFESRWQRHCSSKLTSRPELVNWTSVGVEMIHSDEPDKKVDYTDKEIVNAARLWTYIQQRANFPDNCLITHGEIQGHLPKDHKSFRSDPVNFPWDKFADEMNKLRKLSRFQPPASDESATPTKPQKALQDSIAKH